MVGPFVSVLYILIRYLKKKDGSSDVHLYLLELVLRGDGTLVLRVKSDSNPERFIALVEHVLKSVARPRDINNNSNNNNNNNNNNNRRGR